MGQCFENEQLGMIEEAIKCYRRAAENGDREGMLRCHLSVPLGARLSIKAVLLSWQKNQAGEGGLHREGCSFEECCRLGGAG